MNKKNTSDGWETAFEKVDIWLRTNWLVITGLILSYAIIYASRNLLMKYNPSIDIVDMRIGELGDYVAGISSLLAFMWIVISVFQSQKVLRLTIAEMKNQRITGQKSAEALERQNKITKKSMRIEIDKLLVENVKILAKQVNRRSKLATLNNQYDKFKVGNTSSKLLETCAISFYEYFRKIMDAWLLVNEVESLILIGNVINSHMDHDSILRGLENLTTEYPHNNKYAVLSTEYICMQANTANTKNGLYHVSIVDHMTTIRKGREIHESLE